MLQLTHDDFITAATVSKNAVTKRFYLLTITNIRSLATNINNAQVPVMRSVSDVLQTVTGGQSYIRAQQAEQF